LVIAIETPGICLSVRCDDDVVVGPSGSVYAPRYRKRGGLEKNARSSTLDDDLVRIVEGELLAHVEARLCAVDATPDKAFAAPGDADGMVRSAPDQLHVLSRERRDLARCDDAAPPFAGAFGDPCLTEIVRTPGPGVAVGVDRKGMVRAGVDGDDFILLGQRNAGGDKGRCATTSEDSVSELGLFAVAPAEYIAFCVECETEVVADTELRDSLEVWYEHGFLLDTDNRVVLSQGEAEDAIVILCETMLARMI